MKKYLALGDSYTIGEQVKMENNFPNQFVQLLNRTKTTFRTPEIVAATGWTTDELASQIAKTSPPFDNDFVSLLIGVNNQYRGRSIEEYEWQFYGLLCQAILFAKSNSKNVFVLSIPDWGLTPFNKDKNQEQISEQIDQFNQVNFRITKALQCNYIDITKSTREHAKDLSYLTEDQLHYSEKEYAIWAEMIYKFFSDSV